MTARDVPPVSAIADVLALWDDDGWLTPHASAVCVGGPNGRAHVVGVDVEACVGGVVIDPDDHVVADATGCVRIRAARLGEVLGAARRYAAAEQQANDALTAGEPLSSAYRFKKSAVDELREVSQTRE